MSPDGRNLDDFYLARPGNDEIQLDLLLDYQSNVALYGTIQAYLRERSRRCWPCGARTTRSSSRRAPRRSSATCPTADIRFVDSGHFALETHAQEIGAAMRDFLAKHLG